MYDDGVLECWIILNIRIWIHLPEILSSMCYLEQMRGTPTVSLVGQLKPILSNGLHLIKF